MALVRTMLLSIQPLLTAINEYIDDHTDEEGDSEYTFTTEQTIKNVNENEQPGDIFFDDLHAGDIEAVYKTPIEAPIIIKSVKVTKY